LKFLDPNYQQYPTAAAAPVAGLTTGYVPYPGAGGPASTSDSGLPGSSRNPGNWIDNFLDPTYKTYPLTTPTTPAPPPQIISPVQQPATQAIVRLSAQAQTTQRGFVLNPKFEAKKGEKGAAGDEYVTHGSRVQFVVPEGCNTVDLFFSPIEVVPNVGHERDLSHAFEANRAKITDEDGELLDESNLTPGQKIDVHVPWRGLASTHLEAGRLRIKVLAQFYFAAKTC
jgi:hypothetical protein